MHDVNCSLAAPRIRTLLAAAASLLLLGGCGNEAPSPGGGAEASSAAGAAASPRTSQSDRPNIVLYLVDTLRADAVASYGNPIVETPAIDQLAAEGVLYENAIAQTSWTRPSVASLLSATYPDVHGAQGRHDLLSDRVVLLSEVLRQHGYATACITTNPNVAPFFGFDQGYDRFVELYSRKEAGFVATNELITGAEVVTNEAIRWLDRVGQPFFLFAHTIDPHSPYEPPEGFDRYQERLRQAEWAKGKVSGQITKHARYLGEIAWNDAQLGRLLDHLRERGLDENTIVVFTSDHGEEFREHGRNGHGRFLYEESIRVPLILRYPAGLPAKVRVADTVELIDVAPTLLELAGLPALEHIDGKVLPRESAGSAGQRAFASLSLHDRFMISLLDMPWKLIWNQTDDERELYNLADDPREADDLIMQMEQRVSSMSAAAMALREQSLARRAVLHEGVEPRQASDAEIPAREREALQALGYLDAAEGEDGDRDEPDGRSDD